MAKWSHLIFWGREGVCKGPKYHHRIFEQPLSWIAWRNFGDSFRFKTKLDRIEDCSTAGKLRCETLNSAIKQRKASQSIQFWLNLDWSVMLIGTTITFLLLTSFEWLIRYDLLIWHDQLIWSCWFADQLKWLISKWSDQLIKIFLIFFSKKILKRKTWSADLILLIC